MSQFIICVEHFGSAKGLHFRAFQAQPMWTLVTGCAFWSGGGICGTSIHLFFLFLTVTSMPPPCRSNGPKRILGEPVCMPRSMCTISPTSSGRSTARYPQQCCSCIYMKRFQLCASRICLRLRWRRVCRGSCFCSISVYQSSKCSAFTQFVMRAPSSKVRQQ